MTGVPNAPPPQAVWHYHLAGRQNSPVTQEQLMAMLHAGELPPEVRVWREGMDGWVFPAQVPSLQAEGAPLPRKVIPARVRNAPYNCVAMFVALPVGILALMLWGGDSGSARWMTVALATALGIVASVAAVFGLLYLPLRWPEIMKASRVPRAMGLIGGFGLIAWLILMIVLVAGKAAGWF